MPAISVVIPVYNAAPFLREAMDSLLAQTCGDFEAIAVNDGSTDNSLEILQEYAARDSRIRILDGPNGGYGKAMNRGMDAATGKYMAILEPDDYLPREAYAVLLPLAEQHRLDVVRGTYCTFYEEAGNRHFTYYLPLMQTGVPVCPRREQTKMLKTASTTWSSLYSLKFLRDNDIRYHESPGAAYQDTGLYMLSTIYAEKYMLVPDPVYMYRVDNPNSSINTADKKSRAMMLEYDYIQESIMRTPAIWHTVQKAFWGCAVSSWEWMLGLLSKNIQEEYVEELSSRILPLVEKEQLPEAVLQKWRKLKILSSHRERLEILTRTPVPEVIAQNKTLCGIHIYSVRMSAEETVRKLLGIPLMRRSRVMRWQMLTSGISVANGLMDVYYIFGIPVARRWVVRCGESMPVGAVPARISLEG